MRERRIGKSEEEMQEEEENLVPGRMTVSLKKKKIEKEVRVFVCWMVGSMPCSFARDN